MSNYVITCSDEVYHDGIKGMKRGVRRFQTASGSWTELGLRRRAEREHWNHDSNSKTTNEDNEAQKDAAKKAKIEKKRQQRIEREKDKQISADLKKARADAKKKASINAAINAGDQKSIQKHFSDMTTEEIKEALERADLNAKVTEIAAKKKKASSEKILAGLNTVVSVADALAKLSGSAEKIKKSLDTMAGVDDDSEKRAISAYIDAKTPEEKKKVLKRFGLSKMENVGKMNNLLKDIDKSGSNSTQKPSDSTSNNSKSNTSSNQKSESEETKESKPKLNPYASNGDQAKTRENLSKWASGMEKEKAYDLFRDLQASKRNITFSWQETSAGQAIIEDLIKKK